MANLELIEKDVQSLRTALPDLRGVLLASNEGQPLVSMLPPEMDAKRFAALAAAAASVGKRVSLSLNVGPLSEVSLVGTDGQIFLYDAGGKAVLAVIGRTGSNTGLIHLEARWAAQEIGQRM
jgi:hypothetical protein